MEPFSPVTFNDHAGELWIVTILSLIYTACVAAARTYIKYNMFGFDDALIAMAMVRAQEACKAFDSFQNC